MSILHSGTQLFRNALLLEAGANVIGGIGMIAFPASFLGSMIKSSAQVTALSTTLFQWSGGLAIALAAPLLLGYPNTAFGIANRYSAYITLGAGEACVLAIIAGQMMSEDRALTDTALLSVVALFAPILSLRVWCMAFKPEWVGKLADDKKAA